MEIYFRHRKSPQNWLNFFCLTLANAWISLSGKTGIFDSFICSTLIFTRICQEVYLFSIFSSYFRSFESLGGNYICLRNIRFYLQNPTNSTLMELFGQICTIWTFLLGATLNNPLDPPKPTSKNEFVKINMLKEEDYTSNSASKILLSQKCIITK